MYLTPYREEVDVGSLKSSHYCTAISHRRFELANADVTSPHQSQPQASPETFDEAPSEGGIVPADSHQHGRPQRLEHHLSRRR